MTYNREKKRKRSPFYMKIKYLGSAAYDAIPAPFCCCETCRRSRQAGGKNIRTRTQALVDEDLLIDFNSDTVSHFLQYNIDTLQIQHCLITHNHSDHLYVPDMLIPQYSREAVKVMYYAAESGYKEIQKGIEETPLISKFAHAYCVEPYKPFYCGKYRVLPLPANHDPQASPVFYAIEKDEKRLLYAHDTGVFFEDVYEALRKFGRFDLVSLDCTGALQPDYRNGHMCVSTNLEVIEKLKKIKVVDEHTILVINHFSHNGAATYDDLVENVPKNWIVGYDGLTLEF